LSKHEIDELLDDLGYGEMLPDQLVDHTGLIEKLLEDY